MDKGGIEQVKADLMEMARTLSEIPGSRFVSPLDLSLLISAPIESVTRDTVAEIARELEAGTRNSILPEWVTVNNTHFTLAESFFLLAEGLTSDSETLALRRDALGPIDEPSSLVIDETLSRRNRNVTQQDVIQAAAIALEIATASVTPTRPYHVPFIIPLGEGNVNPAELLSAMATAFVSDKKFSCPPIHPAPPYAEILTQVFPVPLTSKPLWYAALQLWTVKPAPFLS